MTLLALFDSKQKKLRSELRNEPSPELVLKHLQTCFDDMYHEYSVAQSLDVRGQRELAFVLDVLKQSAALLLSTGVSSTKVSKKELDLASTASQVLDKGQIDVGEIGELARANGFTLQTPFGPIKAPKLWTIVKGVLGFFLFAVLWFQSQFFPAFLVLVMGGGDLAINLLGLTGKKKKAMTHSVSVDTAQLLAAVGELVKCAEKLLSEKQSVAALANPDTTTPNRLPVSLFQDLIEARYANDGDLSLKRILKLPASLEDMGIRAVDYDGYNADYFDILPKIGEEEDGEYQTAVPALIKGDQVLARGRVYL